MTSSPGAHAVPSRADLVAELSALVGSAREARWIVEHVETAVQDRGVSAASVAEEARALARRRATGEPLQYVLGRWPFRELELVVDRRVLIPRPETEQLVEVALGELDRTRGRAPSAVRRICVDLGTGSGAIALSLASEATGFGPGLDVWATDRSRDALAVAAANLSESHLPRGVRVQLREGTWFDALPGALAGAVDLVVSNPPYVADEEFGALDPSVREWEPEEALRAQRGTEGTPGLADIEQIVHDAPRWLHEEGSLVLELDPRQADAVCGVARRAGFRDVGTADDLAGTRRFLVARRG